MSAHYGMAPGKGVPPPPPPPPIPMPIPGMQPSDGRGFVINARCIDYNGRTLFYRSHFVYYSFFWID